ncbi:MAG: hypothetical protein V1736_11615 [Pseudomonadota bacterium]
MKRCFVWKIFLTALLLTLVANAAMASPTYYRAEIGDASMSPVALRQNVDPIELTYSKGDVWATAEVDPSRVHGHAEGNGPAVFAYLYAFPEQRYRFTATGSTLDVKFDYSVLGQTVFPDDPGDNDWAEVDLQFGLYSYAENKSLIWNQYQIIYQDAWGGSGNPNCADSGSIEQTFVLEVGKYYDLSLYTWLGAGASGNGTYATGDIDLSNVTVLYSGAPGPVPPPIVPIPGAAWLLGSGLVGLIGFARRRS